MDVNVSRASNTISFFKKTVLTEKDYDQDIEIILLEIEINPDEILVVPSCTKMFAIIRQKCF